jgi:hypothetical protein
MNGMGLRNTFQDMIDSVSLFGVGSVVIGVAIKDNINSTTQLIYLIQLSFDPSLDFITFKE